MTSRRRRRRSTETSRLGWDRTRIALAVVLASGAAILAVQVIRTSSTAILLGRGHPAVAIVAPEAPDVLIDRASREFARNGEISDEIRSLVTLAAQKAPLAEIPFILEAVRRAKGDDEAGAIRLLEEARRRNPRTRLGRLLLVEQYVRADRVAEAANEIKVLTRLLSDVGELLGDQLARLALDPETRPALRQALGADPLLDGVLTELVRRGADANLILELAAPRMQAYSAGPPPDWQLLLIRSLVEAGRIPQARDLWSRFHHVQLPANEIFNPNFEEVGGTPPFNWYLAADAAGVAERGRDGSLDILYFGRADAELASQLLLLAPGRYQLEVTASAVNEAEGSRLAWRIDCVPGNDRLGEIGLDGLNSRPQRLRMQFSVPATGCSGQWIRLVGEAAEFPARREIQLRALRLQRMETSQ